MCVRVCACVCVCVCAEGDAIAAAQVKVWDLRTYECVQTMSSGHEVRSPYGGLFDFLSFCSIL